MTVFKGQTITALEAGPAVDPGLLAGTARCFIEEITLNAQTTSDTIEVAKLPKGARVLYGVLSTDTSLSTAEIAIGITGTTGKYRAQATLTATVPEIFGVNAALGEEIADDETVFITIAVASLPASGTLRVMFVYSFD